MELTIQEIDRALYGFDTQLLDANYALQSHVLRRDFNIGNTVSDLAERVNPAYDALPTSLRMDARGMVLREAVSQLRTSNNSTYARVLHEYALFLASRN